MVCILVTGIPAAGKSFFSGYLSGQLGVPCIAKDSIKEVLFDTIGFDSRNEKVRLDDAASDAMLYFTEQLMKSKTVFIVESNFEKKNKSQIIELINRNGYKCITVCMSGEYDVLYKRLILRNKSLERHPGHIVNDHYPREIKDTDYNAMSYEQYVREIEQREMDEFDYGDTYLRIDTTEIKEVNWQSIADEIERAVSEYQSDALN